MKVVPFPTTASEQFCARKQKKYRNYDNSARIDGAVKCFTLFVSSTSAGSVSRRARRPCLINSSKLPEIKCSHTIHRLRFHTQAFSTHNQEIPANAFRRRFERFEIVRRSPLLCSRRSWLRDTSGRCEGPSPGGQNTSRFKFISFKQAA